MPLPTVLIIGNLVADPELKFTASGTAVAKLRVASQDRKRDENSGKWVDGDSTFLDVTAWRQTAENVGESLSKGDRVVISGRLRQRTYETKAGESRTVFEVEADDIGPSLYRNAAKPSRANRTQTTASPVEDDPWATGGAPF